jgi:hypothetical protein
MGGAVMAATLFYFTLISAKNKKQRTTNDEPRTGIERGTRRIAPPNIFHFNPQNFHILTTGSDHAVSFA